VKQLRYGQSSMFRGDKVATLQLQDLLLYCIIVIYCFTVTSTEGSMEANGIELLMKTALNSILCHNKNALCTLINWRVTYNYTILYTIVIVSSPLLSSFIDVCNIE